MQFKIKSETLSAILSILSRVIPSKVTDSTLEYVTMTLAEGHNLTLMTSDTDITVINSIVLEENGIDGSVAVYARNLLELLKTIPAGVDIVLETVGGSLEVSWGNGKASFPLFEPNPVIVNTKGNPIFSVSLKSSEILAGIHNTIGSVAEDSLRPTLAGIHFDFSKDGIEMVGTDSHQLVVHRISDQWNGDAFGFEIDEGQMRIIQPCLEENKDVNITVEVFGSMFRVKDMGGYTVTAKLVPGIYPGYKAIIPKDNTNVLEIDRKNLINTIKRVSVCGDAAENYVLKMTLSEDEGVGLSSENLKMGTSAEEKLVGALYTGEKIVIGFKKSILEDILKTLTSEKVKLYFKDARHAAIVVPSCKEETAFTGLVMPVYVK